MTIYGWNSSSLLSICLYIYRMLGWSRDGNGSGLGRVFPYSDPTRRSRLVTQTRPVYYMDFFPEPGPAPTGPRGLHGPRSAVVLQGPFCGPIKKKKKRLPNIDFLSNQTGGEKEHSRKLILFSATNRSEQSETNKTHYFLSNQQIRNPFFFHYNIFPHQKQKPDRSEQ